ncbi:MAG: hypothetical protein NC311_10635 [Muribaculaceae bacterium]|nr:hypothetical protein [Muribaculaceae bacterium]
MNFKKSLRNHPTVFYALSIAATWAGAGSLMNASTLAKSVGIIPTLIWCICNALACIIFGLLVFNIPSLRNIMRAKACKAILTLFSVFQVWVCMTALQEAWTSTPLGSTMATVLALGVAALLIVLLIRRGIIANILTDNGGMYVICALALVLAIVSFIYSGGDFNSLSLGLNESSMQEGIYKGILLIPGPFVYPYFFDLLDYNEKNNDGVKKCNITKAFVWGGIAFGIYMAVAFMLCFTEVAPILNICKAVLISALAISSLTSFVYSIYVMFGKKIGIGINIFAWGFWWFVAPLGVMGVWTLMSELRIYLVCAIIGAALIKTYYDRRKQRLLA